MKNRYIISLISLLACVYANAQGIQIRSAEAKPQTEDLDLLAYDGKSPYFDIVLLNKHPHYYDGKKILFLPNADGNYDYYDAFRLLEAIPCPEANDTIWNKNHTKIKKVTTPVLDVYKPSKVENGKVRTYEFMSTSSGSGDIKELSGFFTPKEQIEGRVFTIISSSAETIEVGSYLKEHPTNYTLLLEDCDGKRLLWKFSRSLVGWKYCFMPVVMNDYIESYQSWVGKYFIHDTKHYLSGNEREYFCKELVFFPKNTIYDSNTKIGYFYSPVLSFIHNGKEILYEIIPKKDFGWLTRNNDLSDYTFANLVEKNQYLALKESAREAKLQQDRADSLARAERDAQLQRELEERVAQEAARYKELKRKYGKTNADLIVNGEVRLGWSKEMCRESWGEPNDINTSIGSWGTHEQWVYYSSYLYFENGKLTSIQL